MSTPAKVSSLLTVAYLAELPDDNFQLELDEGELIRTAPAGGGHGLAETRLIGLLFPEVERRKLGVLFSGDTGFVLGRDPDTVRSPDVAFMRRERLRLCSRKDGGYVDGAPDLAVEIQSPSQSPADLNRKVQQYLAAGTLWVIYPRRKLARVFRGPDHVDEIGLDGFLEAPEILPGIPIALRQTLELEGLPEIGF